MVLVGVYFLTRFDTQFRAKCNQYFASSSAHCKMLAMVCKYFEVVQNYFGQGQEISGISSLQDFFLVFLLHSLAQSTTQHSAAVVIIFFVQLQNAKKGLFLLSKCVKKNIFFQDLGLTLQFLNRSLLDLHAKILISLLTEQG